MFPMMFAVYVLRLLEKIKMQYDIKFIIDVTLFIKKRNTIH